MSIRQRLLGFLGSIVPDDAVIRGKKLFFLTTLYLTMNKDRSPSTETLEKANDLLGLADKADALKLPAALCQSAWAGVSEAQVESVEQKLAQGDINGACAEVVSLTPKWMQYGDEKGEMIEDIRRVMTTVASDRYATQH